MEDNYFCLQVKDMDNHFLAIRDVTLSLDSNS